MTRWGRLRSDLVRPETPTGPDERLCLIRSSIAIVVLAQVSDPGSALDVLVVSFNPRVAPRVLHEFRTTVRPRLAEAALIVSEATVKSHVGAIFAKLGARDRAAAIVFAYDHGIVAPHPESDAK